MQLSEMEKFVFFGSGLLMFYMRIIMIACDYHYSEANYVSSFKDWFKSKEKSILIDIFKSLILDIFINISACIGIIFFCGFLLNFFLPFESFNLGSVLFAVILTLTICIFIYFLAGLYNLHPAMRVILFICLIGSAIFFNHYIRSYESKISYTTNTVVTTEERELLYLYNIPVQNISGNISGRKSNISGEISTLNEIPYWYINQDGDGVYGTADANNSKIVSIDEETTPYVEIEKHQDISIYENNNNGERREETISETFYYTFYLPESIIY